MGGAPIPKMVPLVLTHSHVAHHDFVRSRAEIEILSFAGPANQQAGLLKGDFRYFMGGQVRVSLVVRAHAFYTPPK